MERKLTGGTLFPCGSGTRRACWMVRWLLFFMVFAGGALAVAAQGAPAAATPRLQISAVERAGYPTIGLNLIATTSRSERRESLDGLRLWENGVPVADFTLQPVAPGVELFLLLDLAASWADTGDDAISSATQIVQDSLVRLAGRYLESERDVVWLGASGDGRPDWLLQERQGPGSLVDALEEVALPPESGDEIRDPQALLTMALDSAETAIDGAGRFRAIVLFTSGDNFSATALQVHAERAVALQIPVFVVLVGSPPLSITQDTLAWITEPTRGAQLHLASAPAADELYELIVANATQTQLSYQTYRDPGGVYPVRVALGAEEASATLNLELQPPQLAIQLEDGLQIRRVGLSPDTALASLQPASQTVPVSVGWPDGVPRRLAGAALSVDGEAQPAPVIGGGAGLEFEWDISTLDEGRFALTVQVTDTAGLAASSPPLSVAITVSRPEPTATPRPSPAPPPATVAARPLPPILVLVAGAATLLVAFALYWRMRPLGSQQAGQSAFLPGDRVILRLATGESWPIEGEVTVGRAGTDLILSGAGVALLHARIVPGEEGFWLYDEGSSMGTFVNGERLELAGRRLLPGDELRFGDVIAHLRVERA